MQRASRKFVHLRCEAKEAIIRIHNVTFGKEQIDSMRFPELEKLTLLKTCYGQILQEVRQKRRFKVILRLQLFSDRLLISKSLLHCKN